MSLPRVVGVVGVGLVGGSFVRALRTLEPAPRLVCVEPNEQVRAKLEREFLADFVASDVEHAPLDQCDVVVLATPVAVVLSSMASVAARMRDRAVLTDVAGVKRVVVDAARARVRREVPFVGAHPMFGGDSGGFEAAREDRWKGGVVAVCDDGEAEAVARIVELHAALGAEVVVTSADAHDAAVAVVSHLPYVVASALSLVARDAGPLARTLAGRGFLDATRLARFDYDVQGEVARRNPHLRASAARMHDALDRLMRALDDANTDDANTDDARRDDAQHVAAVGDARRGAVPAAGVEPAPARDGGATGARVAAMDGGAKDEAEFDARTNDARTGDARAKDVRTSDAPAAFHEARNFRRGFP